MRPPKNQNTRQLPQYFVTSVFHLGNSLKIPTKNIAKLKRRQNEGRKNINQIKRSINNIKKEGN